MPNQQSVQPSTLDSPTALSAQQENMAAFSAEPASTAQQASTSLDGAAHNEDTANNAAHDPVTQAQAAVELAQANGDPNAVRTAEQQLKQAQSQAQKISQQRQGSSQ
jgi:hypothetical protein